ncbi:MAG TPA: hypothetical protein VG962_09695 [Steroidobacteraceae bacterium]|nr:hypothetical protein [Steroidobacteraceae bacterium]
MNNVNSVRVAALLMLGVAITTTSGCATIFAQNESDIRFKAEPSDGTTVYVAGKKYALDGEPISVPKKTKEVLFSNPTYGDFAVPLDRNVNGGWVALDILFTPGFGLSGLIVDGSTSKWYNYPATVKFDFSQSTAYQTSARKVTHTKKIAIATPQIADAIRNGGTKSK